MISDKREVSVYFLGSNKVKKKKNHSNVEEKEKNDRTFSIHTFGNKDFVHLNIRVK